MHDLTAPQAEALIATLLAQPETVRFESKRVSGKMVGKALATVCAFANTNGGTIFVGVSARPKDPPIGIPNVGEAIEMLRDEIEHKITPPLDVAVRW